MVTCYAFYSVVDVNNKPDNIFNQFEADKNELYEYNSNLASNYLELIKKIITQLIKCI